MEKRTIEDLVDLPFLSEGMIKTFNGIFKAFADISIDILNIDGINIEMKKSRTGWDTDGSVRIVRDADTYTIRLVILKPDEVEISIYYREDSWCKKGSIVAVFRIPNYPLIAKTFIEFINGA